MGVITWFMTNSLAGAAHQEMSETSPGADATSSPATGWTTGKVASGNYASLDAQTTLTTAALGAGVLPGSTMTTTAGAGNALRTTNTYNGTFAAGNWVFHGAQLSTVSGGGYAIRWRLWRGTDPSGAGATDILGADQVGGNITSSTSVQQDSQVTVAMSALTLTNEYLFATCAIQIIAGGGSNTCDSLFRVGTTATRVIATDFTPAAGSPIRFDKTLGTFSQNSAATTIPLTTSAAAVSGSRVFAIVEWAGAGLTLSSVAGGSLTWTVDVQLESTGAVKQHIGIASANAPAGLASSTVITATFSASATSGLIAACSTTGLESASAVDATHTTAAAISVNWTDTVTTLTADTFVLGASGFDCTASPTSTPVNGTEVHDFFNNSFAGVIASQYRIESTTGAKQVNGTWSNSTGGTGLVTVTAAYKIATVATVAPSPEVVRRSPFGM